MNEIFDINMIFIIEEFDLKNCSDFMEVAEFKKNWQKSALTHRATALLVQKAIIYLNGSQRSWALPILLMLAVFSSWTFISHKTIRSSLPKLLFEPRSITAILAAQEPFVWIS
jgi:hypothetical protein